jgi:hypothetical protein
LILTPHRRTLCAMNQGQHPADEYLEDAAEDRFYGERAWNVLEQEPASLYKLEATKPPPLRLWGGDAHTARDSMSSKKQIRTAQANAGFLPLAIGGVIGALLAALFGRGWLAPFGAIAGILCAAAMTSRR